MGERQHSDPGSGMNNPDHIFSSLETIFLLFWGLKYFNSLMGIRDPGWRQLGSGIRDGKKSDPGSGITIPDPPHCYKEFATISHFYRRRISALRNVAFFRYDQKIIKCHRIKGTPIVFFRKGGGDSLRSNKKVQRYL
jgi:hypothetical protein